MSSDTPSSTDLPDIPSGETVNQSPKKPKKSWLKRIFLALFILLLLLTLGLVFAYIFRMPLISYALQNNLPDGVAVSIGQLDIAGVDRNITLDNVSVKLQEPAFEGTLNVQLDHIGLLGLDYVQLTEEVKDTGFSAKELAKKIEDKIRSLLASKSESDLSIPDSSEIEDTSSDHNVLAESFYIKGIDVDLKSAEMSLTTNLSLLEIKGIDYTYSEDHDLLSKSLQIKDIDISIKSPEMSQSTQLSLIEINDIDYTYNKNHDLVVGSFEFNNVDLDMKSTDLTLDLNLAVLGLNSMDYTYLTDVKDPMDQHDASIKVFVLSNLDVKLKQQATKLSSTFRQLNLGDIQFKQAIADLKKLELDTLKVDLSQPDVPVNKMDLASLNVSNVNVVVQKGDVTLESLKVKQFDAKLDEWQWLAGFSAFELNKLALSNWSESITLANTKLSALELEIEKKETVLVPELTVSDIKLKGQKLGVDSVELVSPRLHLIRNKKGLMNIAPPIVESKKNPSEQKDSESKGKSEPFEYVINTVVINKKAKAGYVKWEDNYLASLVNLQLLIDELKVKNIDSNSHKKSRPITHRIKHKGKSGGELSQAAGKSHAMLSARLTGDSPIQADAWFDIAKINTDFAAVVDLKHIELPLVSPYVVDTIGYKIQSGQFSTHVDIAAVNSKLDGNVNLKLVRTDLKPADKDVMERFNKELTMPLPTALNLLEDGDEEIELDMPLKGDIDDPSFSAKGIMRFVTVRAIKEATVYYVKSAILPQNTLFSLVDMFGGMVYDKLTELPAIKYKKAQVELSPAHKAFLDNVANMMLKKKKLRFGVCALASPLDGEQVAAVSLADQRAALIRQYLVQEHKIATQRLMQCLTNFEEKLKQPEVKLIL